METQFDVFKMEGDPFIHLQVQGSAQENPIGCSLGEKKGSGELANFQG